MTDETTEERQRRTFRECFDYAYDAILEWVATNMAPQDVYDRTQLEEWARTNGWTAPPE